MDNMSFEDKLSRTISDRDLNAPSIWVGGGSKAYEENYDKIFRKKEDKEDGD